MARAYPVENDGGVSGRSYDREIEKNPANHQPRELSGVRNTRKTGNFYAVDRQSIFKLAVDTGLYAGGSDM
jgi:hypothetical protein